MIALFKLRSTALALAFGAAAFTAGCTTEEPSTDVPAAPAATRATAETPAPTSAKVDDAKAAPTPATETKPEVTPTEVPSLTPPKVEEPKAETPKTAAVKLTDEEIAAIKTLPPEDQKIALAQAVCPVSGGHLGEEAMGAPIKVTAEGKTFFLCCGGCKAELKADPKGVIAKLAK